ncbi:ABC transporter ATP-binding protein [Brucella gallinifaecis]|uniref:ABC transporter ATP-binding protein n=1 Tax=Brucella gallinifaecis TaxID=215590 RepID=A0A502BM23_9HYPH|nr:ABC transporter ATP-binding protein [Brucella gallinifaecis]TPF74887.1 ABC transporter ATP-binding protein [Brucella gallinifaecis]
MPPLDDANIIQIRQLNKNYGSTPILRDVDLDVRQGEFLTLLGPSGSGKTTMLSIIAGILQGDSGSIKLRGVDISHLPPEKRDIAVVFQNYALFPHMTVTQNVAFPLKMRGIGRNECRKRVEEALTIVKLEAFAGRYPSELSGGQQQRVALARAQVFGPAIMLMDEPLSALDKRLREHMKSELKLIQQRLGLTVIYVTHDQGEALALSDRIAVMEEGRIAQLSSPQEIYERPANRFVAEFIGEANLMPMELFKPGQTGTMLVRPEYIYTGDRVTLSDYRLDAQVQAIIYEGTHYIVSLQAQGRPITVRLEKGKLPDQLAQGQWLKLGWDANNAHELAQ